MANQSFKVESSIALRDSDGSLMRLHHDGVLEKITSTATGKVHTTADMVSKQEATAISIALGG